VETIKKVATGSMHEKCPVDAFVPRWDGSRSSHMHCMYIQTKGVC
jgi:hypothetical protein